MECQATSMCRSFEARVRVRVMRAPEVKSYSPPLEVGKPLETLGVGEVVRSDNPDVKVGSTWRGLIDAANYTVVSGIGLKKGQVLANEEQLPWTNLVASVGMPSAWVGLYDILKIKKGETIFISAASGAVGVSDLTSMISSLTSDPGDADPSIVRIMHPVSWRSGAFLLCLH
ncbi:hypothetical protein JCM3765_003257 [Sporobolomyces pararoseus]